MTKIPLSIKSDLNDDIFEYLTESEADGIISIKWDLLDVEISYDIPKISRYWPKVSEIKKHTPPLARGFVSCQKNNFKTLNHEYRKRKKQT